MNEEREMNETNETPTAAGRVHISRTTGVPVKNDDDGSHKTDEKGRKLYKVTTHTAVNDGKQFVRAVLLEAEKSLGRSLTKKERKAWTRRGKAHWKEKQGEIERRRAEHAAAKDTGAAKRKEIEETLGECPRRELLDMAKGGVVKGYSKMSTDVLRAALIEVAWAEHLAEHLALTGSDSGESVPGGE